VLHETTKPRGRQAIIRGRDRLGLDPVRSKPAGCLAIRAACYLSTTTACVVCSVHPVAGSIHVDGALGSRRCHVVPMIQFKRGEAALLGGWDVPFFSPHEFPAPQASSTTDEMINYRQRKTQNSIPSFGLPEIARRRYHLSCTSCSIAYWSDKYKKKAVSGLFFGFDGLA
jgi:hypothetical protein